MTKTKLSEYESNDDIKKLDNPDNMVSDKIGLKRFANTGRGVVAKRDININETILQIRNLTRGGRWNGRLVYRFRELSCGQS